MGAYAGGFGQMFTAYDKSTSTPNGRRVPLRCRAALFPSSSMDDKIHLFGGQTSKINVSAPTWFMPDAEANSLWVFDISASAWSEYTSQQVFGSSVQLPNAGFSIVAPELGLGLVIDRQIDSGTSKADEVLGNSSYPVSGILSLDTSTKTVTNLTSPPGGPTTRGTAAWFPNVGTHGIVVQFGGTTEGFQTEDFYTTPTFMDLSQIYILDASTILPGQQTSSEPKWYSQQATGQIPEPRVSFCTVTVSAQDNSSHNVYLYGGRDDTVFYDDIYVLSLPSFQWTNLYRGQGYRAFHTCHLVGESKLISIGGSDTVNEQDFCDDRVFGVAIYNMNSDNWTTVFDLASEAWMVPSKIYEQIGGNATGGATVLKPQSGFSNPAVAAVFAQTSSSSSPSSSTTGLPSQTSTSGASATGTTTSASGSHGLSKGAIAGIAVPVSIVSILIVLVIAYFINPWKRSKDKAETQITLVSSKKRTTGKVANWLDGLSARSSDNASRRGESDMTPSHVGYDIELVDGHQARLPQVREERMVVLEK